MSRRVNAAVLFRAAFLLTLTLMTALFAANVGRAGLSIRRSTPQNRPTYERIDEQEVRRLLEEGTLSNREALFYEVD